MPFAFQARGNSIEYSATLESTLPRSAIYSLIINTEADSEFHFLAARIVKVFTKGLVRLGYVHPHHVW